MRVTHVITRLIVGGAQENTVATILGLQAYPDIQTTLITGPSPGPEGSMENAFAGKGNLLRILPSLVRPLHPARDLIAFLQLTKMFRATRPDLVHTHSGKAGILGRLAAQRAGVPLIVHTIHGPSFGPFQGSVSNQLFLAAERRAGRCTTHFVSVADAMTRQYLAAGIGQPSQYTRIFSGFPLAPFLEARNDPALRGRLGLAPDDFVVGKIARLYALKGHDDLIAAAPAFLQNQPRAKFLLVGDGLWRERLRNRIRALGLTSRFVFAGLVSPAEIPSCLGVMDVMAHLSRREGLARALTQALAAARPIVAADCDGASEVCRDGETGFLIHPGDTDALVARLTQLAKDKPLRERLGKTGQEFVRQNFAVETMVENIYKLYRRLATEKNL
jgi:glycosyltransferase involved in cell wall biosynthesis